MDPPDATEELPMSSSEDFLQADSPSRLDKIRRIQPLERDEGDLIEPGLSYPVWSPDQAFVAASALLHALEDEKGQP